MTAPETGPTRGAAAPHADGPRRLADVEVGQALPPLTVHLTRLDLVRYAGASGDFNTIHWSDRVAAAVGLPGVIAHGMLTMAHGARLVTDWAGDPGALVEYFVRFAKPVVVPDDETGAELTFTGRVAAIAEDGIVRVDLSATAGGQRVLGLARALVRLR
jgi:acyl dehydratase